MYIALVSVCAYIFLYLCIYMCIWECATSRIETIAGSALKNKK